MTSVQTMNRPTNLNLNGLLVILVFSSLAAAVLPSGLCNRAAGAATTLQEPSTDGASRLAQTASNAQNTGGNYDFAASQWEKLIQDFPDSTLVGKAHFNAGICQIQTTEFRKAIDHFQSAIPKLEDEAVLKPHANLYLGFAQFKLGQDLRQTDSARDESTRLLTTATQTLANLLKTYPKFSAADQACYFQGGAFEELDRLEDAVDSYQKIFDFPNQTFKFDGLFALADLQFQLGQFEQSLKYSESFRTEADLSGGHPKLDDVILLMGKTLAKLSTADENAGDQSAADGKLEKAIELFQLITTRDPKDRVDESSTLLANDARYQQAFCEVRLKRFGTAARLFEMIASDPQSPFAAESLAFAGQTLIDAGETEKAIETLKKSVASNSAFSGKAAHWLARVYLKTNEPRLAYDLTSTWIPQSSGTPVEVALMMDQADAAYEIPDLKEKSIELFDAIVSQHPDHQLAPSALYNSAFASLDANDYASAIESAKQFEASFETSSYLPDTLDVQAESYLLSNQLESAAAALTRLIADYPTHEKATYWKLRSGLALYLQTQYAETITQLTPILESLETPREKAEALHWIGASQFQLGQVHDAAVTLLQSNQADVTWRRADETLLLLVRSQLADDQSKAGQATAEILIEKFPESKSLGELYFRLGERAYDAKQYEQALVNFNQIIQEGIDSNFLPYSLYNAAWSQLELKHFSESNELFTQLIDQYPDHDVSQRAIVGRSAARRKSGNTQTSIDELKEFLKTASDGAQQLEARYELGLAQVQASEWDGAVETFKRLLLDFPDDVRADRFSYELAWAHKERSQDAEALALFTEIAESHAESSFAAEANFHVGKFAYDAENYDIAIKAFERCVQSKTSDNIREKAAYKLAWAHYKQDHFQLAHDRFAAQVDLFPQGDLAADGLFMVAESLLRLKQYEPAFDAYLAALPAVDAAVNVEPKIKWLTRLHGAQCGNRLKKFSEALELVSPLAESDTTDSLQQDAWLEMGSAHQGLNQPEKALEYWRLASQNMGKTGARAFCMIGDHYFGNKQFQEAINQFKQVYFGFGGTRASKEIRQWQAYAIYEAARCNFVQVKQAPQDAKPQLVAEAIKQFEYLLENYGDDSLAPEARKQLETLKKLKLN